MSGRLRASTETERLLLRPLSEGDVDEHFRLIATDPEVMRWLPPKAPQDRAWSQGFVERFGATWERVGIGPWAVVVRGTGAFAGHCGLRLFEDSGEVEVLYALGRPYWGHGYATEAARASVAAGFEDLDVDRIVGYTLPGNGPSQRVLEKCGMQHEGPADLFGLEVERFSVPRATPTRRPEPPRPGR